MPLDATTFTNILGSMFFRLLNFSLNESRKPMSGMSENRYHRASLKVVLKFIAPLLVFFFVFVFWFGS